MDQEWKEDFVFFPDLETGVWRESNERVEDEGEEERDCLL